MLYEKVKLEGEGDEVSLACYVADKIGDFKRSAILVLPGGAYRGLSTDREGDAIATSFMAHGYNAFVLSYSVTSTSDKPYPAQLIQASKAIKHIKDNAEKYGIDPENVFAVGFSAGGHLCGSLGTMWNREEVYKAIDMPYGYNKPKGVMLIYPVISMKYYNSGTFENLLKKTDMTEDDRLSFSIEENVTEESSPMFIMHTSNDQAVDVRHSIALASALAEKRLKFELHIYPDSPHGVALGNEITACGNGKWNNPQIAKWVENAVQWAKSL